VWILLGPLLACPLEGSFAALFVARTDTLPAASAASTPSV